MRKNVSLDYEILGQIALIVVFFLLLGCWFAVQYAGFRSRSESQNECQLLDVQILPRQSEALGGKVCRVLIRMDEKVRYTIHKPNEDSALLIDLPHTQAAPGWTEHLPSNDIVERVWLHPSGSRMLTVGLALSSPDMHVVDLSSSGLLGAREINLELRGPESHPRIPAEPPTLTHQTTPLPASAPARVAFKR